MSRRAPKFQIVQMGDGRFLWRMLCRNGREPGRSTQYLSSVDACLDDLASLYRGADRAELAAIPSQAGGAIWELRLDGLPRARARTSFEREWDLMRSFEQFRDTARRGLVDPSILVIKRTAAVGDAEWAQIPSSIEPSPRVDGLFTFTSLVRRSRW